MTGGLVVGLEKNGGGGEDALNADDREGGGHYTAGWTLFGMGYTLPGVLLLHRF